MQFPLHVDGAPASVTLSPATTRERPEAAPSRARLAHIDALRGFACLWVLIVHLFGGTFEVSPDVLASSWGRVAYWGYRLVHLGGLGVNLFLVLSGFCLFYPLLRKQRLRAVQVDVRDFARRRVRRILPPYIATLAISAFVVLALGGTVTLADILSHLTLTHNLAPATVVSLNGPLWTLALEAQLYLLFPVLVWAVRARGLLPVLAAAFLLSAGWQVLVWQCVRPTPETPASFVWFGALPARCFEFVMGICAAALICDPAKRPMQPFLWAAVPMSAVGIWWSDKLVGPVPFHDQWWGVTFAMWLMGLSACRPEWFRGWSPLGLLSSLGVVSYSVYLLHVPCIEVTHRLFRYLLPGEPSPEIMLALRLLVLGVIILSGTALYHWLERPFLKAKPLHVNP